jgi:hypothetical protein
MTDFNGEPIYYDRNGEPMGFRAFAEAWEGERHVGNDEVRGATATAQVSTVWLGINHNLFGGPPLIFETMVFGGPLDQEQERYATEEQARAGHAEMLARVRAARAAC